jgi:hypothetical protein
MEKDSNLRHGYTPRQERRKDHKMESVNPNKIAFIEALDYHISEIPIHGSEGGPKFPLPTTISVNRALSYVIHAVFGIL